jgi:regulator of sirC expression with transglutaminase-like and TPR domain
MPSKKKPSPKDLHLLLSFLIDKSEQTSSLARRQLQGILSDHPECRDHLLSVPDPQLAYEARAFLEESRMQALLHAFEKLAEAGEQLDLERGAYLLATLAYPNLSERTIKEELDALAENVEEALDANDAESVAQSTAVLRQCFFRELGFRGNEENYYDPDNSYINRVLDRRMGIPISIAVVYLLVAQRLDLPVHGIGLPGHFILAHLDSGGPVYLDPFHQGRLLSAQDCVEMVRQRGLRFQPGFLEHTPPRQILSRMIANLITIYTEQGASERAQWLSRFLQTLQGGDE